MVRIEDYALLGDTRTAALVGLTGSIDWWCVPRFDSPACLAALLGSPDHGRWLLAPAAEPVRWSGPTGLPRWCSRRRSPPARDRCGSPTRDGRWAPGGGARVDGITGRVRMRTELVLRPEYGLAIPCLRSDGRDCSRWPAPTPTARQPRADERGPVAQRGRLHRRRRAGVPFALVWHAALDGHRTGVGRRGAGPRDRFWWTWAAGCTYDRGWRPQVLRSLLTLKALTFAPTGGLVAAATTSLPKEIGGVRNWDYRYCWLRTPRSPSSRCLRRVPTEGARVADWLVRAAAGTPPSCRSSTGSAVNGGCPRPRCRGCPATRAQGRAGRQRRSPAVPLDVYGESSTPWPRPPARSPTDGDVRRPSADAAGVLRKRWRDPDDGIWEVRAAVATSPTPR